MMTWHYVSVSVMSVATWPETHESKYGIEKSHQSGRGGFGFAPHASSTSFSIRQSGIASCGFQNEAFQKLQKHDFWLWNLCRMSKARRDRRGRERESFNTRSVMQLYCWFCCKWLTTAYWSAYCLNKRREESGMRREKKEDGNRRPGDKGPLRMEGKLQCQNE